MKETAEDQQQIDYEACRLLGIYRRRLMAHEMSETDEIDVASILLWVEEYVIAPGQGKFRHCACCTHESK